MTFVMRIHIQFIYKVIHLIEPNVFKIEGGNLR